jgi:hypothetical protein
VVVVEHDQEQSADRLALTAALPIGGEHGIITT